MVGPVRPVRVDRRIINSIRCTETGRGSKGFIVVCADPGNRVNFEVRMVREAPYVWRVNAMGRVEGVRGYVRKGTWIRGSKENAKRELRNWIKFILENLTNRDFR